MFHFNNLDKWHAQIFLKEGLCIFDFSQTMLYSSKYTLITLSYILYGKNKPKREGDMTYPSPPHNEHRFERACCYKL